MHGHKFQLNFKSLWNPPCPLGGGGGGGGADWTRRLIRNVNKHTWILDGGSWVKSRVTSWVKNVEKKIAVQPPGPIHPFFFRTKTINALFTKLSTNDLSFLSILLIKIMCGVVYPGGSLFQATEFISSFILSGITLYFRCFNSSLFFLSSLRII